MRVVIIAKMKKSTKDIGGLPAKCTTCTRAEFYTVETRHIHQGAFQIWTLLPVAEARYVPSGDQATDINQSGKTIFKSLRGIFKDGGGVYVT